ncbi:amino acid-binding protein [Natrinema versiforme]|uniref:Amino acid-binding protein n=1 Tax=Natrinema versiforme TaxID=88724 RepID=A0A4P8WMY7_9EURY|nr:amino acid-binding protein [Natrinema versiforme]QCS44977.1 amino acid-binding protein [Natrinema versiforme]
MSDTENEVSPYTLRLELADKPGELLRALRPISNKGGNLLSIFHERGNITPRGHIPVEVDMEATPTQFTSIVDSLRSAGVNVIEAGSDQYKGELRVVLVGHLVDTDLSDTLQRIQESGGASITDIALSTPLEKGDISSAQLRLSAREGDSEQILKAIRSIADEKDLQLIEPAMEEDQ